MNIEQIDSRVGLKESQIYRIIASGPIFFVEIYSLIPYDITMETFWLSTV